MTIAIVILFTIISIKVFKKDLWEVNEELLKQEVLNIGESVILSNVTPFEWDIVYSFNPYTSKDTIYKAVGYKWDTISETVSESMNQLVFMKDDKVVHFKYRGELCMNKFGFLSILMVLISIITFFILRGPNANLSLAIILLGSFSLLGIIFAVISKRWLSGIIGVLANGMVLVFVYFLLLANGIAG